MPADRKRLIKLSKYLSRHLRHEPARLGLTLEPGGWVQIDALLQACAKNSVVVSQRDLEEVVTRNDKRRFSFDESKTRIRANQGHSVEIDLDLDPVTPPATLYHGTSHSSISSIMRFGLNRQGRHHVHLSTDVTTALAVGRRHGRPVVLLIAAQKMLNEGHTFYVTDNGVWLTAEVPTPYLHPLWSISN